MTCQQVEELIDLFAADACDAPTREAVQGHIRECAVCTSLLEEAQRLQGQLDVHLQQGGVERLQQRIEAEDKHRKKPFLAPFLRRVSLVAAMVLIAFGLIWWLPRDQGVPTPPA